MITETEEEEYMLIQKGLWQSTIIHKIRARLQPNEAVRALLLKGSTANPHIQPDTWGDVDLTLVVADGTLDQFFPSLDWLAFLGEVYADHQSSEKSICTTRACLLDFRRLDCSFVQESDLSEQALSGEVVQVLFSRSPVVDAMLAQITFTPPPADRKSVV